MKNSILTKILVVAMLFVCNNVSAQKWLKNLTKAVEDVASVVGTSTESSDSTSNDVTVSVKWDSIPTYTAQMVYVVENGDTLLNEDGTKQVKVFLVDQFGNKRSKEAVAAQQQELNKALLTILAKVGGGAALGALASDDKAKGALIGGAAGALASMDDIKMARAQQKSLKQQKKLLEAYSANFTDEGDPVDATVDVTKIEDLTLAENSVSASADEIKAELASEAFNTADNSALSLDSIEI